MMVFHAFGSLVGALSTVCPFGSIAESMEGRLSPTLTSAAIFVSPKVYSRFVVSMIVYPLFGEIVATRFLEWITIIVPSLLLVQALPILLPHLQTLSRARQVDAELPFFVMCLTVFSHESFPTIQEGFSKVASVGKGLFRAFERESAILQRNLAFMNRAPDEIVTYTFASNPSRGLKEFVHGFQTTLALGKDVCAFVESEAFRHIALLEDSWRRYSDSLASVAEFSFLMLALFPAGLQMIATTLPSLTIINLLLLSYVILGVFSVLLLLLLDAVQPSMYDRASSSLHIVLITICCAASMLLYHLGVLSAVPLILVPLVASMMVSYSTVRHHRKIREGEEHIWLFMHQLAEESKVGISLPEALSRLALRFSENSSIRDGMLAFCHSLRLGESPTQAAERVAANPAWLVRIAFGMVSLAFLTGSGFEQLERLSVFFKRVADARRVASRSLIPFVGMGLAVPAISVSSLSFLSSLRQISSFFVSGPSVSESYAVLSITLASFLTGVLLSKLMTMSVRNSVAIPLVLLSTLVSFVLAHIR